MKSSLKKISKILAKSLDQMMPELIRDYQSRFVKRRSILESVATTKEVINQCKKTGRDGYLLKLDFQKAYDAVDWECLREVLGREVMGPNGDHGSTSG